MLGELAREPRPCVLCHTPHLALQFVTPGNLSPGASDLELDNSHLDLLNGSQIVLLHDADLESEDASTVWIAGGSSLQAVNHSKIEMRLNHILMEGGSRIVIKHDSEWNVSQVC